MPSNWAMEAIKGIEPIGAITYSARNCHIADALDAAYARGLEDAAKVAKDFYDDIDTAWTWPGKIAAAIRALKEKTNERSP